MFRRSLQPRQFLPAFTALLLSAWVSSALGQETPTAPAAASEPVSADQIESLVKTLEDPTARAHLVEQLKVLIEAEREAAPASEVQTATAQLLSLLSQRVSTLNQNVWELARAVNELPDAVFWAQDQVTRSEARQLWMQVLISLAMVLGFGYAAFFVAHFALRRPHRALASQKPRSAFLRPLLLLGSLLLDLVPISAFGVVAYFVLGVLDPGQQTRFVALAWINASIIVRLLVAAGRFVFAPDAPNLRLAPMDDESAHYANIWVRRLSFTSVYGYFGLQAALLLGLPGSAYLALLSILGLLVATLVAVLIVQNRAVVAAWIRGPEEREGLRFPRLRRRIAALWHVLAVVYVFLVYAIWALNVEGGFIFLLRGTAITLTVVILARLAFSLLDHVLSHGFSIRKDLKARFPDLERRANRYVPVMHKGLKGVVYFVAALAVLQAWGLASFEWFASEPGRVLGGTVASVVAILVFSVIIWEAASSLIEGHLAETDEQGRLRITSARTRTLLTVARNALLVLLSIVSTLLVLSEIGVNITPLLAGAGVVGLAVGFGSQTLVKDIIGGVFILFQDLFSVGDVIKVDDKAGVVEAVSIRTVQLRDLSGTVHTIPFGAISTISNLTKDFSYYLMNVGVAYRESVDQVMDVLRELGAEMQQDPVFGPLIREPLEVLGVDAFADSAVIIKARLKTVPIKQWAVGREFNRRMKNRFDALGIEIPFPHRTLYFGVDKQGQAPPARVQTEHNEVTPAALEALSAAAGGRPDA